MGNVLAMMKPGLRVVRGPDWIYDDQDGGEGHVGTLVEIGGQGGSQIPEKHVTVVWDMGGRHQYRVGYEDAYDLRVYDNSPCGVVHIQTCDGCLTQVIKGLRWTCAQCPHVNLCTGCYMMDKHDTSHAFERFETDSQPGISVPSRLESCDDKIEAKGLFIGATVTRGSNWQWGNQDGGEGCRGKVVAVERWVSVDWDSAELNKYRLGHDGRVDLKCVTATSGGPYYKTHLPVLGQMVEDDNSSETNEDSTDDVTFSGSDDDSTTDSDMILGDDAEDDDHDESNVNVASSTETCEVTDVWLGLRVVRGPDWKWKDQDGGEGHVGTVVEIPRISLLPSSAKIVTVLWDSGNKSRCRVGQKGKFDLLVFDNAQINIEHKNSFCDGCQGNIIRGIRWACTVCKDFDLCSKCYGDDKHDLVHSFWRFEDSAQQIPKRVPQRLYSQKVQAMGIAKGAEVVRGGDWEWKEQDGGDGGKGRVIDVGGSESGLRSGWVKVEWTNGSKNIYRFGINGKFDLKCTRPTAAGFYYRSHLPVFGKLEVETSPYSIGEKVKCKVGTDPSKLVQQGKTSDTLAHEYTKQVGTVSHIDYHGQVEVCYKDGKKITYHPDALMQFWLNSADVTALIYERNVQTRREGSSVDPETASVTATPDQRPTCLVCAVKEAQVAFVPCGHLVCCPNCGIVRENCPICQVEIENLLLTFIP